MFGQSSFVQSLACLFSMMQLTLPVEVSTAAAAALQTLSDSTLIALCAYLYSSMARMKIQLTSFFSTLGSGQ